ncbi:MAG: hypothetical protein F6J86_32200 [Symploca sp. SIO1B1]|nr:hypothetical protein [Symploca sp. SIO1B1]
MNRKTTAENEARLRWKKLLEKALEQPEEPVFIMTLRRALNSSARPVFARGFDKREYVIKGQQAGRQIINDQIIARLGCAMDAPVAEPQIVEIDRELLELDPTFDYLTPGKAHGVVFIPDCSDDREGIRFVVQQENRKRFALLAVLFGWTFGGDLQFIYKMSRPNLVFSVDHGHFFPSGPNWTIATLNDAPNPVINPEIRSQCSLEKLEIEEALEALQGVTEEKIIQAVASPPKEWELTIEERIALVEYLITRQQQLLLSKLSN